MQKGDCSTAAGCAIFIVWLLAVLLSLGFTGVDLGSYQARPVLHLTNPKMYIRVALVPRHTTRQKYRDDARLAKW